MSYSSRPGPAARPAAKKVTSERNMAILRTLLKDPQNKFCADCKTSAHPRWASWSLGIFVCIRGMGTHISKDLDTWNDEHIAPMVQWGNHRANLYWEHKLPANYVPDDSKMENFIRTKYDLKRWVIPGPKPDPSSLKDEVEKAKEEDAVVQKRLKPKEGSLVPDLLDAGTSKATTSVRKAYHHKSGSGHAHPHHSYSTPSLISKPTPPTPNSLFDLDFEPRAASPGNALTNNKGNSAQIQSSQTISEIPTKSSSAPPAPGTAPTPITSRPDLKKSILSLYSSVPSSRPAHLTGHSAHISGNINQVSNATAPITSANLISGPNSFSPASTSSFGLDSLNLGSSVNGTTPQLKTSNSTAPVSFFDDLLGSSGGQSWASTPTHHQPPPPSASNGIYSSSATEWNYTNPKAAPKTTASSGPDDDIFGNVWK